MWGSLFKEASTNGCGTCQHPDALVEKHLSKVWQLCFGAVWRAMS